MSPTLKAFRGIFVQVRINYPHGIRTVATLVCILLSGEFLNVEGKDKAPYIPKAAPVVGPVKPSGAEVDSVRGTSSSVIAPFDVVSVSVLNFNESEIESPQVRVMEDGVAYMQFIGGVKLAGKTTKEAAEEIRALYEKDYLRQPSVILSIVERQKQEKLVATGKLTLLGQVSRPGILEVPLDRGIPIMEVIGMAGGFTRIARESKVSVKRHVEGREQVFKVNCKDQASGESTTFLLYPGDIITVDESLF